MGDEVRRRTYTVDEEDDMKVLYCGKLPGVNGWSKTTVNFTRSINFSEEMVTINASLSQLEDGVIYYFNGYKEIVTTSTSITLGDMPSSSILSGYLMYPTLTLSAFTVNSAEFDIGNCSGLTMSILIYSTKLTE